MRIRRLLYLLGLGVVAVLLLLFFTRRNTRADFGPAVALCPGPDLYGYHCASGTGFSYLDATEDIVLYEDDGVKTVSLPFPFTFYGTTYSEITISSNGNAQFGSQNPEYFNQCLSQTPATAMSDMLAPFWDDFDVRLAGFIEIDTFGEAPNRIFVVEWDNIPYFGGDLEDLATFELQLFEGSNDILFLYEDVNLISGSNGRSATIGIQSANQGVALQFSCNQSAVADASRLLIEHPEAPNADLGQEIVIAPQLEPLALAQKEGLSQLTAQLNQQGASALTQWQQRWLSAPSPQMGSWEWVDLSGNGRSDLILIRNQPATFSDQSSLTLFEADSEGQLAPIIYYPLSSRETAVSSIELLQIVDLTHDNQPDALFRTLENGQFFLATAHAGTISLETIPERCMGSWIVRDLEGNGRNALIREGCDTVERPIYHWQNGRFEQIPNP